MPASVIVVEIYRDSDPFNLVDVINARSSPSSLKELSGPSAGSFTVSRNDPKIIEDPTLLDYRNIVKIRVGDRYVGAFMIQNVIADIVGSGEKASEVWQVSGEGLKTWAGSASVLPPKGLVSTSKDTRFFNFASERGSWYVATDWVPAVQWFKVRSPNPPAWGTAPKDWPDAPNAYWIWDRASRPAPAGAVFFRREFQIVQGGSFAFFFAIDDYGDLYLDGELLYSTPGPNGWQETTRVDFDLLPGSHVLALRGRNKDSNSPGGFLGAFFRAGDATLEQPAQLISVTDSTWRIMAYPAVDPGWTVGDILLALINEARARGVQAFNHVTPTFTSSLDSYGQPWTQPVPWGFEIGANYNEVFDALEESVCDIYIDPDTLEFSAWNKRGVDLSMAGPSQNAVDLAIGKNLLVAETEGIADIRNVLIVQTLDGWREYTDANSIAKYGRLEAKLKVDLPATAVASLAKEYFSQKAQPEESTTFEILPIFGAEPFIDFDVGDYVTAPNAKGQSATRRILSISVSEDDKTARPIYSIEFDTIFSERKKTLEEKFQGGGIISGGGGSSGGGGGGQAAGTITTAVVNQVPTGTIVVWPSLTIPDQWLELGQAVSRTTYAALFSVIGTTFGPGNGSTTFDLPPTIPPVAPNTIYVIRT